MTCRGKQRYDSLPAAERVISRARDARKRGWFKRQERRAYACRICRGWHVTSEEWLPIEQRSA